MAYSRYDGFTENKRFEHGFIMELYCRYVRCRRFFMKHQPHSSACTKQTLETGQTYHRKLWSIIFQNRRRFARILKCIKIQTLKFLPKHANEIRIKEYQNWSAEVKMCFLVKIYKSVSDP